MRVVLTSGEYFPHRAGHHLVTCRTWMIFVVRPSRLVLAESCGFGKFRSIYGSDILVLIVGIMVHVVLAISV